MPGMNLLPDFHAFQAQARGEGFDEVLSRELGARRGGHAHPPLCREGGGGGPGEMWLTVGDDTRHLQPGDRFELDREVPHAERYGAAGATYWVARRN